MSGGSFNYLFRKDVKDLLSEIETITSMRNALLAEGLMEQAEQTAYVLKRINKIQQEIDNVLTETRLREVWKAIEWYYSGDHSRETMLKIIRRTK